MHVDLPKKLYYSIGEVAKGFGVKTSLIRFWDSEFSILKPKKNAKGNRRFTPDDIKNLASRIAKANFQMNTHAIGDSTVKLLIDTYSRVLENKEDPRWRIEHSQIIDLIKNHFNNNDYLMIKASNATGLNKMVNNLKGLK